jgi:3-oxoacyl-[acyl-carrier protein] reductase
MDLMLKGKRALVLGASAGLGRAIAEALVQEGAAVAICSRDEARVTAAAKEIGAQHGIPCDLSQPGAAVKLVETAIQKLHGVDILVTNTGGPPTGTFGAVTTAAWQTGFQSLWLSTTEAINAALPGMRERKWGRVLLVTSVAAKEPMAGLTVSNGLRAGLLGLTKSLATEVAADGVTVNALLPGYTRTERLKELKVDDTMLAQIPARRLGEPEELAAMTTFLASPRAAYVTGQAIAVDGGYLHGL